jgi:hypothetical protein
MGCIHRLRNGVCHVALLGYNIFGFAGADQTDIVSFLFGVKVVSHTALIIRQSETCIGPYLHILLDQTFRNTTLMY